ncbi:MAG: discoidin domain-containing protein [Mycobacteriales bacterium]
MAVFRRAGWRPAGGRVLAVVAVLASLAAVRAVRAAPPAVAAGAVTVWVQDGSDRPFTSSTPPPGAAGSVALYAARDDTEAAQILVRSPAAVSNVSVVTGALAAADGSTIPATDVTVRREYNHPNISKLGAVENPPDGGSAYYDALIDDSPVTLAADSTLAYFYQVTVPTGQAPGVYSGTAAVTGDGISATVPVTVTVYDVTIPPANQSTFKMNNWFTSVGWDYTGTPQAIPLQYGVRAYDANWWKVIGTIAADAARHRDNVIYADFQALLIPGTTVDASGHYTFDWTTFDRFVQVFVDAGAMQYLYTPTLIEPNPDPKIGRNSPVLDTLVPASGTSGPVRHAYCPPNSGATAGCPDTNAYLDQVLPALKAHLDTMGWTDRFYLSALDEPTTQAEADAANWLYRKYAGYFPHPHTNEAHVGVFAGDEDALTTVTPVTAVQDHGNLVGGYDHDKAHYQSLRLAGKDLWLYTAIVPQGDYMNRFISNHLDATRLLPWLAWKTGADGYLHWGWNYWVNGPDGAGAYSAADTFDSTQDGDAWLVRPDKAHYGVYDSLRSEAQTSGLQDYELLNILRATKPVAAQAITDSLIIDLTHWDRSGADVEARHKQILDDIAAGGPDAAFPFSDGFADEHNWRHAGGTWSVSGGQYTQSDASANWGVTSAVEGRAYGDFAAAVDVTITGVNSNGGNTNWAGMVVRSMDGTDMDTGYLVALRDNGQVFVVRGGAPLGAAPVPGYVAGRPTHLRVVARGPVLTVYAGSSPNPLLTVTDGAYRVGDVALVTGAASARFATMRINPMTNPVEGATVTASSSYEADGWAANAAVDGQRTSGGGSMGWSSAGDMTTNHTEWVQLDLGAARPIGRVDLYPRDDGGNIGAGFPVDFSIETSADGSTWQAVATRTGYPRPGDAVRTFPFPATVARYVRVTGTNLSTDQFGHYHMQFAEIETAGGDLAAGRPVSASSSVEYANESWLRTDATDGVHHSDLWYSMGWSSLGASTQHTEWVQVDLGGPTLFDTVDLYPRDDGADTGAGFPVDFTIQASTDGSAWQTVATQAGYPRPDAGARAFTFAPTIARYVRVTGAKLSTEPSGSLFMMQLAELEVR